MLLGLREKIMSDNLTIRMITDNLGKLNATYCSVEDAIAEHLLLRLSSYKYHSKEATAADIKTVSKMLQAYALLLQDHGVKVDV